MRKWPLYKKHVTENTRCWVYGGTEVMETTTSSSQGDELSVGDTDPVMYDVEEIPQVTV